MAIRVLIVEDNGDLLRPMVLLIRMAGAMPETARSVSEALAKLDGQRIALLDLRLPDGTGVEILQEIRANHPRMRVAILSAEMDGSSILAEALSLTPDAYFPKPFDVPTVLAWIQEHASE